MTQAVPAYSTIRPTPCYFVVMIDYDRKGREAVVDPELTRIEVVSRIRSGEYKRVAFVHHVTDGAVEDVTDEILHAAEREGRLMSRFFVSSYTDGPDTWWNVIDRNTQEWVWRFPSEGAAFAYARKKEQAAGGIDKRDH